MSNSNTFYWTEDISMSASSINYTKKDIPNIFVLVIFNFFVGLNSPTAEQSPLLPVSLKN